MKTEKEIRDELENLKSDYWIYWNAHKKYQEKLSTETDVGKINELEKKIAYNAMRTIYTTAQERMLKWTLNEMVHY